MSLVYNIIIYTDLSQNYLFNNIDNVII
jgi:hypothetical protein